MVIKQKTKLIHSFWLWEVWQENRRTFKLLVGDAFNFICIMAFLYVGHFIIAGLPLHETRREFLEYLHFMFMICAWIFLSLILFLEILLGIFKRFRQKTKIPRPNGDDIQMPSVRN